MHTGRRALIRQPKCAPPAITLCRDTHWLLLSQSEEGRHHSVRRGVGELGREKLQRSSHRTETTYCIP